MKAEFRLIQHSHIIRHVLLASLTMCKAAAWGDSGDLHWPGRSEASRRILQALAFSYCICAWPDAPTARQLSDEHCGYEVSLPFFLNCIEEWWWGPSKSCMLRQLERHQNIAWFNKQYEINDPMAKGRQKWGKSHFSKTLPNIERRHAYRRRTVDEYSSFEML